MLWPAAKPGFLRTTRSTCRSRRLLVCSLPSIEAVVSVFVDDVDQAETAVRDGAGDLLLRDWDADRIGELRQKAGPPPVGGADRPTPRPGDRCSPPGPLPKRFSGVAPAG